ncbi:MAG TPA: ATP-dependent 6-phosphofructokinase [Blastocatellia bacterium]|nr:ATP-dependent 6-phosphofructokinase [Blastocatellia bacterium]
MSQERSADVQPKRIGLVTGGGDCPGLNAVIRAVVIGAINCGWEVFGIEKGFEGLLHPERVHLLNTQDVRGIIYRGGTILGTTNRGNPFRHKDTEHGQTAETDLSDDIVAAFHDLNLDSLVVIGGDGTLTIANQLSEKGIPVIGVPKTIDNDLMATEMTFGFSTAVATATDAIDKLHATAESHERVMIVEVMGRNAGWIALYSGVAGGADVILIPEIAYKPDAIAEKLHDRWRRNRNFAIVVAAEGAIESGGEAIYQEPIVEGQAPKLGGIAEHLAKTLGQMTGYETRSLVLGHLQRGGQPTPADRLLATRFGAAAVRAIQRGERNVMVAYQSSTIISVPLKTAIEQRKQVPLDYDVIRSARDLGISFGDA